LLAIPLCGFIGLAIDVTRAYMAKVELQGACDTAALAAATLKNQTSDQIKALATKYFYSNYSKSFWAPTTADPDVEVNGQNITVSATGTQNNYFLRLFGYDTFDVAANASAVSSGSGLEVAMVLDVPGSMSEILPGSTQTKLTALKNASTDVINILFGSSDTSDLLQIGIVPFAASVHLDPTTAVNGESGDPNGWIDTKGQSSVARLNFDNSYANNYAYALYNTPTGNGYMSTSAKWVGCVEARPISGGKHLEETDDPPTPSDPDTLWVPYFSPDNPDNLLTVKAATTANISSLKGTMTIDGVSLNANDRVLVKNQSTAKDNGIYVVSSSTWSRSSDANTAAEVQTAAVYVTNGSTNAKTQWNQTATVATLGTSTVTFAKVTPVDQSYNNNYLSDVGPGTPRAHQTYTAKYRNANPPTAYGASAQGVNRNCVPSQIQPLTNDKQTLLNAISGLTADGNTHIPIGVGWGWRVLSPTPPYTEGHSYTDPNWTKALIIETDGTNTMPGDSTQINQSEYTAYGFADQERLGAGVNTTDAMATEMNNSLKRVCDNIKAVQNASGKSAILIYTIGFGSEANTTTNKALLQYCASSPDDYYYAPTNADLETIFTEIAQQLSKIRLTK
jgi:Flp pilus assembly protein TadG